MIYTNIKNSLTYKLMILFTHTVIFKILSYILIAKIYLFLKIYHTNDTIRIICHHHKKKLFIRNPIPDLRIIFTYIGAYTHTHTHTHTHILDLFLI